MVRVKATTMMIIAQARDPRAPRDTMMIIPARARDMVDTPRSARVPRRERPAKEERARRDPKARVTERDTQKEKDTSMTTMAREEREAREARATTMIIAQAREEKAAKDT
jgi:hypothetical protein